MQILIPVLFLSLIGALLIRSLQLVLRNALSARVSLIFLAPVILSALFCGVASALDALNTPLAALILIYTLLPAAFAFLIRSDDPPVPLDFAIILLLWLPLEFSLGRWFVPRPEQGLVHIAAYGVSVVMGLTIFLLFRRLKGMKYNLPRSGRDLLNPLMGFAIVAPILIMLGRAIGFLDPFHAPARWSILGFVAQFLVILAATALPEEILFRGLIQNCLMQKLGANTRTLLLAALIFGCAHLNNGPQNLPNWRYMIIATVAGAAYGKVFEKSSSIFASAFLHALVNTIKHSFF